MNLTWLKRIKYAFERRAIVLMYHNINSLSSDPWELGVSPENFEQHLTVLKRFKVIPPVQLISNLNKKSIENRSVCLTFDDGYQDNFIHAKPLLEKYSSPAMFFISTHFIASAEMFWWDELTNIILETFRLPQTLDIPIDGNTFFYALDEDAVLTQKKKQAQQQWVWHQAAPTKRCALYLELWKRMRALDYAKIKAIIGSLYNWSGCVKSVNSHHAMSGAQLDLLKKHPFIQTGIHCVTHPALSNHSYEVQKQEISRCKSTLENLGHNAQLIAYPYGDFNQTTLNIVSEIGVMGGFTTRERVVTHRSRPMQVGRFQVRNVDGDIFEKQLHTWFTRFPGS